VYIDGQPLEDGTFRANLVQGLEEGADSDHFWFAGNISQFLEGEVWVDGMLFTFDGATSWLLKDGSPGSQADFHEGDYVNVYAKGSPMDPSAYAEIIQLADPTE
jgi:hypothetical protein